MEQQLLKLNEIADMCTLLFMYKFVKKELPAVANVLFKWNYEVNKRATRSNNKLYVQSCKSSHYQRSIRFQGVAKWNGIVDKLEIYGTSLITFKKHLKNFSC